VCQPVGDFRKAPPGAARWSTACDKAKMPGLLFHDLRRSAVREMDRAGVKQTVAMKINGHRTPSMWRRYRIASVDEMREALALTQSAIRAEQGRSIVQIHPGPRA